MGQRESVKFTFTELLYGVVIGTAITRIGSLSLTKDTILLIVALVLVFDDYLLYHQDVQKIEGTGRNFVSLFLFDMVVLAAKCLSSSPRPNRTGRKTGAKVL